MTPHTGHPAFARSRHCTAGVAASALVLTGPGLASCGLVRAVKQISRDVESNKTTIDAFTARLKSGEAYSAAPPASLFRLPAGAKVTTSHHVTK